MGDAGVLMQNWALCFTVRPDASPFLSSRVHLRQRRVGLWQLARHRHGTCGVAGVGSTPRKLLGSEGMRLGAGLWRHALLLRVLRRRPQGRWACVGHPVGVIRTQIPSVTRLTKGHPDGS